MLEKRGVTAYTGVDKQFGERVTTEVRMIPPHLHPKSN